MFSAKDQFLMDNGFTNQGWSTTATNMLLCPCNSKVEDDGECPQGHESPLKQMGFA